MRTDEKIVKFILKTIASYPNAWMDYDDLETALSNEGYSDQACEFNFNIATDRGYAQEQIGLSYHKIRLTSLGDTQLGKK